MIRGVIFDLDGTLVHLPIDYDALKKEFEKIGKISNMQSLAHIVALLDLETRGKLYEAWTRAELKALENVTINEDGIRIYEKHSKKLLALVTMQGIKAVNRILESLKLKFHVIITREDSLDRTQQIAMAVEKLGLKAENVLMVGDRERDKASANRVGCKFVMVRA